MTETRTPKQIAADKVAELIERLEKAEAGSRELDGMIWCAANGYEFVMWDGAGCVYRDPNAPNWNRGIQHEEASIVRPYSASLDAAANLARHVVPALPVLMGWAQTKETKPWARVGIWCGADAAAATPALALCLATLKAVRVYMHPRDREEASQ